MLWLIWIVIMVLVPALAGVQVWRESRADASARLEHGTSGEGQTTGA